MAIKNDKGFSLVEVLIAMSIFLFAISAAYTALISDQKTYAVQDQVVRMHQDARYAMAHISRSMRMAGYDPASAGIAGFRDSSYLTGTVSTDQAIYFTVDTDADGSIDNNSSEKVGYRIVDGDGDGRLDRIEFDSITGGWQVLKDNVTALNFTYIYADGELSSGSAGLPNNGDADNSNDLDDIRLVQVSITVRTSREDRTYTSGFNLSGAAADGTCRTATLASKVRPRNVGI